VRAREWVEEREKPAALVGNSDGLGAIAASLDFAAEGTLEAA
jgi:hypothetical protein